MNQALFAQALAALQANNPQQAKLLCQKLLAETGREFNTLQLLGMAQFHLGELAAAIATIQQAISLNPGFAPAWSNLGMMEAAANSHGKALACFEKALSLAQPAPELLVNLGNTLVALGRAAEALPRFDAALAKRPGMIEALAGRARAQRELGEPARSLADCETALRLHPGAPLVLCHRGIALTDLGRLPEALASFDAALARAPNYAEAAYGKAMVLLQQGDFAGGLPLYEARKRLTPPTDLRLYPQPSWLGQPIAGKTLYLYSGQGLGDVLMFGRFVAQPAAMGAKVILDVPEKLRALFRGFTLPAQIITGAPAQFDFHAPLASLPLALGLRVESIPAPVPYFTPDPALVMRWRERIGARGFKIGIAWQGARNSSYIGRSFPVSKLAEIAALDGVRLISLQRGEGTEQLEALPLDMTVEQLGTDFDSGPDAFTDAAAAMASLDLVISADTAISTVAGVTARPVWMAMRKTPEWRWLLERQDTPWYPTARLFRQQVEGDWDGVFSAMAASLRAMRR